MAPSSGELWGYSLMPNSMEVDIFLPTGVLITLKCARETPLENIKDKLWIHARNEPLYHTLGDASCYIFVAVTQDAKLEEFYDESRRLCDLKLFQPLLKLKEPEGNKEEKLITSRISLAVGYPIHEFEEMKIPEVQDCRRSLMNECLEASRSRNQGGEVTQANYMYPPEIESTHQLPSYLNEKLKKDKGNIMIKIFAIDVEGHKQSYTVQIPKDAYPESIIGEAILKKTKSMRLSREEQQQSVIDHQNTYLLKVCGCDEYLLEQYPVSQYKYIRRCLARGEIPHLMLLSKKTVYSTLVSLNVHVPAYMRRGTAHTVRNHTSLYSITDEFRLTIISATNLNLEDVDQIYVRAGLYYGVEPLCDVLDTERVCVSNPKWNQMLVFNIRVNDLTRNTKLCLSICSVTKRRRKEEKSMVAWGNINIMDYKSVLLGDQYTINLWKVSKGEGEYDLLNYLGYVGINPDPESPCLQLEFARLGYVTFPTSKQIAEYAEFVGQINNGPPVSDSLTDSEKAQIMEITSRDPLTDLSEQEKQFLWNHRRSCFLIPNSLPKLLDAVKWYLRDEVAEMYQILKEWPQVSAETALELLDCKYADSRVRDAAVRWLDYTLDDDKLFFYLLQLTATLKHEQYLSNSLSNFLLRRALLNRKIGQLFFWHLKAEMHERHTTLRFGLLLEAYCRGLGGHLKSIISQTDAMEKLDILVNSLKERKDDNNKDRLKYLWEQLRKKDYKECLQNLTSPLNISYTLGTLIVDQCKIMDSARRPLLLTWENPDALADSLAKQFAIIFKNGDDLRQDMLTLQVIRIMDQLWLSAGYDLRMLPYNCLATGWQVGIIEVVHKAKTVYGIQRRAGALAAMQVDSRQLHKWIKEHNTNQQQYEQAIETFTRSCAGYCVATFILGIGDRHPDNIMVNEQGQIFHIDFGHFLGHFKKKFGISRERVPFVLTDDFLYVIARGDENPRKSKAFQEFQALCGHAYIMLRRHANLLISLFSMMVSTGIPELQCIEDVSYLRKTLAVEKTEEEAISYFQNQFYEAYGGAWTTKLDWFFHSVRHR